MRNQALSSTRPARRRHTSREHGIRLEPLERRLLLAVQDVTSSSVGTIVYPLANWNNSGVVDGVISKGLYSSDNTEVNASSHADAYTDGSDPGWYSPGADGKLRADSLTACSQSGPGYPAQAQSDSVLDYDISIQQIKPLPKAFANMIFNVPITSHFDTQATMVGNPGVSLEVGDAEAYVEVCLSGGAEHFKGDTSLDWANDRDRADESGEVTQTDHRTFSNTLTYWASTQNSDYLCITLNAQGSSQVAVIPNQPGVLNTYAYSYVTGIEFDQASFNAVQGAQAFQLSDYFQLVYGVDLSKGPRVQQPATTCTEPDIEPVSLTGPTNSATGDLTPTFTGGASVTTYNAKGVPSVKLLKSGLALLYVDGVEAGVGTVSNGVYRVTPSADLSAGSHSFTVSAGSTLANMGPQSQAFTLTIDTSLPRGDTLDVAMGGSAPTKLQFTDGDGTKATITLTAGTATVNFAGDDLRQSASKSATTVLGTDLHITDFAVTGSTATGKLTFSCSKGSKTANALIDLGGLSFAGSIGTITAGGVTLLGDFDGGGAVGSLTLGSVPAGDHTIQAASFGTFKVTGDLDDTDISISQAVVTGQDKVMALGTFTVTGAMNDSSIDSAGHIGTVKVGRLLDSSIFAGVDTGRNALGALPDEEQDFVAPARLDSLTITGVKNQTVSFENSYVAAAKLGTINIIGLPTDSSASGGVAGESLLKLYTRKNGKVVAKSVKGPLLSAQMLDALDGYIARLV